MVTKPDSVLNHSFMIGDSSSKNSHIYYNSCGSFVSKIDAKHTKPLEIIVRTAQIGPKLRS